MKKATHPLSQICLILILLLALNQGITANSYNDWDKSINKSQIQDWPEKNVKIYPNPFVKEIFIENPLLNIKEAVITDVIGKQVIKFFTNERLIRINADIYPEFSSMNDGIYFLTITKYDGNSQTTRIVKAEK
jgi:hypothetical protein